VILVRPRAPWLPGVPAAMAIGYVVLYVLLDWVSYVHPMRGTHITPWNPQAALAVALLTWSPRAWWLVGGTMAAAALVRAAPDFGIAEAAAAVMLSLGYLVSALALRRWLGPLPRVTTRLACLIFLLVVGIGAALNMCLYVGTLGLFDAPPSDRFLIAFPRAWIGDVVSLVVMLPVVHALADPPRRPETLAMLRTVEWWLVAAAAMLAAWMVFALPTEDQFKFFYLLFLPVAWGAARFGGVGATWSAALVQLLLILAVQSSAYVPLTVFQLHMLMAALGATGLLLGTTVEEREQAEQALRASLHVAAAGDMAAALAHELNQPLTALRTYARAAQLLAGRLEGAVREQADELVDVTNKLAIEANRAGDVVRRLRDFFRRRGTELQRTDIGPLIDAVLGAQALRAASSHVALQCARDPALPAVWLDAVQIEVVLRNLVSNALDAAAEGTGGGAAQVTIGANARGGQLVVEVIDSGHGIAAEELPHLFDTRRPSSKPGGMGLGLAISRAIVEAHEGRLWAEPGPGGRFFFSLPLATAESHE
jgi:two-component system, LuxR family, sensor kinase FixL